MSQEIDIENEKPLHDKKAFSDLGLSQFLLEAINKKGFENPTPIQAQVIPLLLEKSRDVVAQSQTGTGKTAAFGLPILDNLDESARHIQALILAPTRELSLQVCQEIHELKGQKPVRIVAVYGGDSIGKQTEQLKKGAHIVVATPGRLMDHVKRKNIDLSRLNTLVLDEADEMLSSGFIEDIEWVLSQANKSRQVLLFSATISAEVLRLSKQYMQDSVVIRTKASDKLDSLTEQFYMELNHRDMLDALCRIIDVQESFYGFVFCQTKRDVDQIYDQLMHRGFLAEAMHGDLSQFQRKTVLTKFRRKQCSVLVVTDVAARGIDVEGVSHVINMGLPQDAESYVHRIGRTGRAGKSGQAITLVSPSEFRKLTFFQRKEPKIKAITKMKLPEVTAILESKTKRIKDRLEACLSKTPSEISKQLAQELLALGEPKAILEAFIEDVFSAQLQAKTYKDISAPSRGGGGSSRGFRSGGGARGGQRSDRGGERGGNKRFDKRRDGKSGGFSKSFKKKRR